MAKIKAIHSALPMDGAIWEVGKEIRYKSGYFITGIEIDKCTSDEDHVHVEYHIYLNNKLWKTLVNMPVEIEYELGDEN